MVIPAAAVRMIDHALALAQAAAPADKLPPPTRAALFMALVGIALIGLFFVVAILLGGHWVRRLGNYRRGPSVPPDRQPIDLTKASLEEENDQDSPAQPPRNP